MCFSSTGSADVRCAGTGEAWGEPAGVVAGGEGDGSSPMSAAGSELPPPTIARSATKPASVAVTTLASNSGRRRGNAMLCPQSPASRNARNAAKVPLFSGESRKSYRERRILAEDLKELVVLEEGV